MNVVEFPLRWPTTACARSQVPKASQSRAVVVSVRSLRPAAMFASSARMITTSIVRIWNDPDARWKSPCGTSIVSYSAVSTTMSPTMTQRIVTCRPVLANL